MIKRNSDYEMGMVMLVNENVMKFVEIVIMIDSYDTQEELDALIASAEKVGIEVQVEHYDDGSCDIFIPCDVTSEEEKDCIDYEYSALPIVLAEQLSELV